ncbi:unnamed protein product [Protopolystoma xenopodis]|uniref:Uncharacterized protein n=1 Tax=Protopolystoma xenopodis TaxID=117903 RepID=A0A3S5CH00_9PLAT|nr:unnamed protein product [Protopolystoma xenopodis]
MLALAVISILISAPLGAILIPFAGPYLLQQNTRVARLTVRSKSDSTIEPCSKKIKPEAMLAH